LGRCWKDHYISEIEFHAHIEEKDKVEQKVEGKLEDEESRDEDEV
jgi:hypothetical protein